MKTNEKIKSEIADFISDIDEHESLLIILKFVKFIRRRLRNKS